MGNWEDEASFAAKWLTCLTEKRIRRGNDCFVFLFYS